MEYLFGPAAGQAITLEPPLLAMLVFFAITTLIGAVLWYVSGRWKRSNALAGSEARRLGQALFWAGVVALLVAGLFHEGALLRQRFWLYLMLLVIYSVVAYALYYRFVHYPQMEQQRQAEQARRRRYVPPPQSLNMPSPTAAQRRTSSKRRRRAPR